jgi:hypothetical protein
MYPTLKLPCYYVPSSQNRIASLGRILNAYPDKEVIITPKNLILTGSKMEGRGRLIIPFCKETHLPMGYTKKNSFNSGNLNIYAALESTKKQKDPNPMGKFHGSGSLTEGVNFNLAEPEKELLKWHYRLGHIGMQRVQWLLVVDDSNKLQPNLTAAHYAPHASTLSSDVRRLQEARSAPTRTSPEHSKSTRCFPDNKCRSITSTAAPKDVCSTPTERNQTIRNTSEVASLLIIPLDSFMLNYNRI